LKRSQILEKFGLGYGYDERKAPPELLKLEQRIQQNEG